MKRVLIIGTILLIIAIFLGIISDANAQFVGDQCSVGTVHVENSILSSGIHTKITYPFSCSNASSYEGQMTKMIITVPYADISGVSATDQYGSMKVLEGPTYIKSESTETDTTIGVIFRKGLLIANEDNSYTLSIEFDSNALAKEDSNSVMSLTPKGLVPNPKVTIISKGITETTIPVENVEYKLVLPDGASVQKITSGCQLDNNVITCQNLKPDDLSTIEIKWTSGSITQNPIKIVNNIKNKVVKFLPGFSDTFNNLLNKILKK